MPENITVNETGFCELEIHCEMTSEQIDAKMDEVLALFKNAPVKGFRPGVKPSIDAIKMQYRPQINDALKRALAETAYHDALFEKNIKPFGYPNFTNLSLLANKFSCDFTLRSKPTFELAPYRDMQIPTQPVKQSIEDLTQQFLQELRVQNGDITPFTADDTVQTNDVIVIDYHSFDGEQALAALDGTDQPITVGKVALPGFDDNLVGMKVGETRKFSVVIPEGGLPSVVGKSITFETTVKSGTKNVPASLDDELAKKLNQENYQKLLEAVSAAASTQHGEMLRQAHIKQITARLLAANTVKIPTWLTLSEAQYLVAGANLNWDGLPDMDKDRFLQNAEQNVKLSLILDEVRENEPEAQLSDFEVIDMIKRTVSKEQNVEQVLAELNRTGQLNILASRIRDEHTLDFLLKHSVIGDQQAFVEAAKLPEKEEAMTVQE